MITTSATAKLYIRAGKYGASVLKVYITKGERYGPNTRALVIMPGGKKQRWWFDIMSGRWRKS